jgi:hypothetical protein
MKCKQDILTLVLRRTELGTKHWRPALRAWLHTMPAQQDRRVRP